MSKHVVLSVAKEAVKTSWKDRQSGQEQEHTGLDFYVGGLSDKFEGVVPLGSRVAIRQDGSSYAVYNGKLTIWDGKLDGRRPAPGDVVECEYDDRGRLRFVGYVDEPAE